MNTLKPGYIPDGWTRGQEVRILPPNPDRDQAGGVVRAKDGEILFEGVKGEAAMVRFRFEDIPEVSHWLAWWREGRN